MFLGPENAPIGNNLHKICYQCVECVMLSEYKVANLIFSIKIPIPSVQKLSLP